MSLTLTLTLTVVTLTVVLCWWRLAELLLAPSQRVNEYVRLVSLKMCLWPWPRPWLSWPWLVLCWWRLAELLLAPSQRVNEYVRLVSLKMCLWPWPWPWLSWPWLWCCAGEGWLSCSWLPVNVSASMFVSSRRYITTLLLTTLTSHISTQPFNLSPSCSSCSTRSP